MYVKAHISYEVQSQFDASRRRETGPELAREKKARHKSYR